MGIVDRMDQIGKPAWIGLMVLGFIVYWPVGLAILAFILWSGRMGCWKHGNERRWDERKDRVRDAARKFWGGHREAPTSGNRAFDEYRQDTLRRLEDEQKEFRSFLDRLRHAKDKAEFDAFMADQGRRRDNPEPPPVPPQA